MELLENFIAKYNAGGLIYRQIFIFIIVKGNLIQGFKRCQGQYSIWICFSDKQEIFKNVVIY